MNPKTALTQAKQLFGDLKGIRPSLRSGAANPEFYNRAAVLADVLLYTDKPKFGEALALNVAGRSSALSQGMRWLPFGTSLPEEERAKDLEEAIDMARHLLFPKKIPCMPNARALRGLLEETHGSDREGQRSVRLHLRNLRMAMRATCSTSIYSAEWWRSIRRAMDIANDALMGNGVERAAYEVPARRFGDPGLSVADFFYVNTGEESPTLMFDNLKGRYWAERRTWDELTHDIEARHGRGGHWRV